MTDHTGDKDGPEGEEHAGHDHSHADHDHDHDHTHDHGSEENVEALSYALDAARTGLRSEVQKLLDLLPDAVMYIPLSEDLPDAPEGQEIELDGELTFRPHMILDEDGTAFAVSYSDPELVETMRAALNWQTSGGDLKFVCAPAHVALDLGQMIVDDQMVGGLVINPGTDEELVLRRDEVASFLAGVAIPLVGYVDELPPGQEDGATVVEGAAPPPAELLSALAKAKAASKDLLGVDVQTTFDPERDREPHLCIILTVIDRKDLDRKALADDVMEEAAPHLPAPGYADIVFRDAPN